MTKEEARKAVLKGTAIGVIGAMYFCLLLYLLFTWWPWGSFICIISGAGIAGAVFAAEGIKNKIK